MNRPDPAPAPGSDALRQALDLSFRLLRAALAVLALLYVLSGVFVVRQDERALVLLFGRIRGLGEARVLAPDLHWTLPRPFAEVVRLATERVRTIETAPRPRAPEGLEPGGPPPPVPWDQLLLSGDVNLLSAQWALRYTVGDPERYLFGFRDAAQVLSNELAHAVVGTSVRFRVDDMLRTGVEEFRAAVDGELRRRVRELDLGVRVERVDLVGVTPPPQVAPAFDDVVQAEQERSGKISEARAYAARRANETEGEAARRLSEARAAADRLVAETGADADYFRAVRARYVEAPDVTARTLRQETLRRVLSAVRQKYFLRRNASGEQELRLWLSPERPPLALPAAPGTP